MNRGRYGKQVIVRVFRTERVDAAHLKMTDHHADGRRCLYDNRGPSLRSGLKTKLGSVVNQNET